MAISKSLNIKSGTTLDRFVHFFVAFVISSAIHGGADFMVSRSAPITRNFFLYQPLGIGIELFAAWTSKRLGIPSPVWFGRLMGYTWVILWFTWCGIEPIDAMIQSGIMAHVTIPISVFRVK